LPPPTSTDVPYGWTFPEVARVSLADAKAAFDEGSAIFVDVRQPYEYEHEHIRGAINIYFRRLDQHMGELDKQQWVITYCA
jgi:rhodanese-related sulfurtransferase